MKMRSICTNPFLFTLSLGFILSLLTSQSPLIAQTTIQGSVFNNNGQAIIGANIYILDSYDGTASSPEGLFTFHTELKGSQILVSII